MTGSRTYRTDRNVPVLQYLGHAGFILDHRGCRLLIDPWFYPAFAKSWFPYPDNRFLLPQLEACTFDFLYISHLHEDHFDRRFLAQIDKTMPVLCPAYRSRSLERALRDLGFTEIMRMRHGDTLQLSLDLEATMIMDTSHKEDSGLLIDADGFRFLDLNDCHPPMSDIPRQVDLLSAQFSGAMWYPNCYAYSGRQLQEKVDDVRANIMDTLQRTCLASDARWYLPSAGPACFLDPDLRQYNDPESTIFARWENVAHLFSSGCPDTQVIELQPGATIIVQDGQPIVASSGARMAMDLERYAASRHREYTPTLHHTPVRTEELQAYFADLQRCNRPFVSDDFDKSFIIRSGPSVWTVTISAYPQVVVAEGDVQATRYSFDVPDWLLHDIVDRQIGWEEALLSMRIRLDRDPDVFDVRLLGLLRYGAHPSQTRQMLIDAAGSGEMIEQDGYRFQRYCPHAGEDLTHAVVRDRVLECPRHHWKWDVDTGQCLSGGSLTLKIESNSLPPNDDPALCPWLGAEEVAVSAEPGEAWTEPCVGAPHD